METHTLKISVSDQNCNWMVLFLTSELLILSHFFCSSLSVIHILMNLSYCEVFQGDGKLSGVKRKLIYMSRGGRN